MDFKQKALITPGNSEQRWRKIFNPAFVKSLATRDEKPIKLFLMGFSGSSLPARAANRLSRAGFSPHIIEMIRAADVTLKERRKLVPLAREAPLSTIHLENMLELSRLGTVIMPPMMTFYMQSHTLEEQIDHIVARSLDQFGLHIKNAQRWQGVSHHKLTRSLETTTVV